MGVDIPGGDIDENLDSVAELDVENEPRPERMSSEEAQEDSRKMVREATVHARGRGQERWEGEPLAIDYKKAEKYADLSLEERLGPRLNRAIDLTTEKALDRYKEQIHNINVLKNRVNELESPPIEELSQLENFLVNRITSAIESDHMMKPVFDEIIRNDNPNPRLNHLLYKPIMEKIKGEVKAQFRDKEEGDTEGTSDVKDSSQG